MIIEISLKLPNNRLITIKVGERSFYRHSLETPLANFEFNEYDLNDTIETLAQEMHSRH
jgi:hypothetical protein